MKQYRFTKLVMSICLVLGMILLPVSPLALKAQAAEVIATVSGTVLSGTTSDLLLLSTKEGKMEIKLDSSTDTSNCKILLPGNVISVSVSHGSDAYLHAVKLSTDSTTSTVTVDSTTTASVSGTLGDKTTEEVLHLNTPQGEMEIKLDPTTNMSGCSVLVIGKSYNVSCARGSDAYMHALSITDSAVTVTAGGTTVTSTTTASTTASTAATGSITGTVSKNTTESILYLSTKDGEMQFKIDSDANTLYGMVHTTGNQLTVSYYHGSDGYLHAVKLAGVKEVSTATVDTSSVSTVTGTVNSKSNEKILYFDTQYGQMELKLDVVNSLNNCKVLVSGKKLSLTCARGSDAYMHALDITAA